MREKNLVRRRYSRDRVTVSELFVKAWEGEERGKNVKRGAEGL